MKTQPKKVKCTPHAPNHVSSVAFPGRFGHDALMPMKTPLNQKLFFFIAMCSEALGLAGGRPSPTSRPCRS